MRAERVVRIFLKPLKLGQVRLVCNRAKIEVVEERSGHANGVSDAVVMAAIRHSNSIQERGQVSCIFPQVLVVSDGMLAAHGCKRTCIVEVIDDPTRNRRGRLVW